MVLLSFFVFDTQAFIKVRHCPLYSMTLNSNFKQDVQSLVKFVEHYINKL